MSDCSNWRGDQIKATVEQEFRERRSEDSGARSVRGRQPERMLRVIAETTERVDVFRTCRVRTCLSLSVNKTLGEEKDMLSTTGWLKITAVNGLDIPYLGYLELNGYHLTRMGFFSSPGHTKLFC